MTDLDQPVVGAVAASAVRPRWFRRRPLAWRHRGFRQLTRAWFFTNVADSALFLMVAVWVKELTGSDGAAALVFGAFGLPALAAPFIGQLADRVSRRRLLVVANLAMGPVVLSLLLVGSVRDLWLVYTVMVAYGAVGYLTASAQSGLVRDLLADDELAAGNGLLTTIDMALRLVSPLLGAALYVAIGPHAVVAVTASCFLVTALLLLRLEVTETPPTPVHERGTYWHEVSAGFRHLARTSPLGRLTLALALGFGATGVTNTVVFPAMEQGLGVDPAALGVLVSIQGAGAVLGGATAATLIARFGERNTLALGLVALAAGLLPVAGSSLALVVVGIAVVGVGIPWVVVSFMTLRQRLTPPTLQGRTTAAANLALNVPSTAATFGAAGLLGVVDYRLMVAVTCGALVVAALGAAGRTPRAAQGGGQRRE
ncbi:MFS transporter [Nocardioides sp.]|uniref:MFS transporter n=1 Tax=Nocardioides sp. TaxID=35761 RepID=UPI0027369C0D|nr:MFS transporter [Nocardioides sp.]MDP3892641.1 MFS transporter [Nocardioides sp.]